MMFSIRTAHTFSSIARQTHPGNARASRADDGALAIANFSSEENAARCGNKHARRVRSPAMPDHAVVLNSQ